MGGHIKKLGGWVSFTIPNSLNMTGGWRDVMSNCLSKLSYLNILTERRHLASDLEKREAILKKIPDSLSIFRIILIELIADIFFVMSGATFLLEYSLICGNKILQYF